jgi:hypothetical protein
MIYRILTPPPQGYDHASEGQRFIAQMPPDCLGVPWYGKPNVHDDRTGAYIAFYLNVEEPPDPPTLGALTAECAAIVAAYDPALLTDGERAQAVRQAAQSAAQNIPGWASWTEEEALAWHDTNIADALPVANLAEANAVLDRLAAENRAILRMLLAARNQLWPNLEGS